MRPFTNPFILILKAPLFDNQGPTCLLYRGNFRGFPGENPPRRNRRRMGADRRAGALRPKRREAKCKRSDTLRSTHLYVPEQPVAEGPGRR